MKRLYAIVDITKKDSTIQIKYYQTKKRNYGIEIVREVENKVLARRVIDNITAKKRNIEKVLELLTRQLITPETAEYIENDLVF